MAQSSTSLESRSLASLARLSFSPLAKGTTALTRGSGYEQPNDPRAAFGSTGSHIGNKVLTLPNTSTISEGDPFSMLTTNSVSTALVDENNKVVYDSIISCVFVDYEHVQE
ncbi:hypothetical protein KIN20_008291 [Parelaphostrongylus tenuis]|uniref:Uncharacterized protein n=1 Tax=Parelaphostrongylus tenuis TaxID=148309 RepID=A0AAD5M9K6_PARTN|nr:hypothetical protein KIN20_008291 [Parelaphostrongylus tenuis]